LKGDKNGDKKVSQEEIRGIAETVLIQWDTNKRGFYQKKISAVDR
jgi:hypothetical protein